MQIDLEKTFSHFKWKMLFLDADIKQMIWLDTIFERLTVFINKRDILYRVIVTFQYLYFTKANPQMFWGKTMNWMVELRKGWKSMCFLYQSPPLWGHTKRSALQTQWPGKIASTHNKKRRRPIPSEVQRKMRTYTQLSYYGMWLQQLNVSVIAQFHPICSCIPALCVPRQPWLLTDSAEMWIQQSERQHIFKLWNISSIFN